MKNAKDYIEKIVETTIEEFRANPTSVRHAFLACLVTYHTVDYLSQSKGKKAKTLSEEFCKRSLDFQLLCDIANSFKHVSVGEKCNPRVQSFEIISRPPAQAGVAICGLSQVGDTEDGVVLFKEIHYDLLNIIQKVIKTRN